MNTLQGKKFIKKKLQEHKLNYAKLAGLLKINPVTLRCCISKGYFPADIFENFCQSINTNHDELAENGIRFHLSNFRTRKKFTEKPEIDDNIVHLIGTVASLGLKHIDLSQLTRLVEIEHQAGIQFGPEAVREIINSLQKPE